MKKITQFLLFTVFTCVAYGQQITLMDFGLPAEPTTGNWNNITVSDVLSTATILSDNLGTPTGETLTLTDIFDTQINGFGTQTPDAGLPFTSQATRDSFFGENVIFSGILESTGGFTLSGLELGKYYSFTIFASRAGVGIPIDNREALYTITGNASPQTATLDATNNTTNVAQIFNVQPNGSGEITIQAETGTNNTNSNGFYYLGAIEMTKTDAVLSNKSFGIDGLVNIYPNPSSEYVKISLSLKTGARVQMNVYDITGKKIITLLNEQKSAGNFVQTWNRSNVASGMYILEIDADGRKHNSKLILK